MSRPGCPTSDDLLAFSIGKLTEEDSEQVVAHLEACSDCQTTIQNLDDTGDSLAAQFKRRPLDDQTISQAELNDVVALVAAIGREPTFVKRGSPALADSPDQELGHIRDYQLVEKLGEGGMGAVYKALHTQLDKVVALKVLPPAQMKQHRAVERFKREMKAVGKLDHPNIVSAHDAGEADGTHFLVMELVEGLDLSRLVDQQGPLHVADACEITRQAAIGLQYVHEQGLVHRDIKPSNLMLVGNRGDQREATASFSHIGGGMTAAVKILDLGLARLYTEGSETTDLTGRGQLMGTLDYMAPEQADDTHNVDIRADIYSLGCTLYKLLSGHAPYSRHGAGRPVKKMMAHANAPIPQLPNQRSDVPAELQSVLEKMMAKDAADRYETPDEVALALQPFAEGHDLGSLAARCVAEHAAESMQESTSKGTDEYLSSAMTGTVPDEESERQATMLEPTFAEPAKVAASLPRRSGTRRIALVSTALAFLVAGAYFAPQVIRIVTNKGLLVVAADAEDIEVTIKQDGVVITDPTAKRKFELKAGENYEVEVRELPEGIHVFTRQFSLQRGGKEIVNVRWELAEKVDKNDPESQSGGDLHRRVAEWVLRKCGSLGVIKEGEDSRSVVGASPELPETTFTVDTITLTDNLAFSDRDLQELRKLLDSDQSYALDLTRTSITSDGLKHLREIKVKVLNLSGTAVTDEGIEHILRLDGLNSINLSSTKVTDTGLQQLAKSNEFNLIVLNGTSVTDKGLASLAEQSELSWLGLCGTQISDDGLKYLRRLNQLKVLQLSDCQIGDAGMKHLAGMISVDSLELTKTHVTDAGINELRGLTNLRILKLGGISISAESYRTIADSFSKLEELELPDTVNDDDLVHLAGLKRLRRIHMPRARISDNGLAHLRELKTLRQLQVWGTDITAAGVAEMQRSIPECVIDFGDGQRKTAGQDFSIDRKVAEWAFDAGATVSVTVDQDPDWNGSRQLSTVQELPDQPFQLHSLMLASSTSDDDIAMLARIIDGRELTVRWLHLTATSVSLESIASIEGLSILALFLNDTQTSDADLQHLAKYTTLNYLSLGGTKVTDQGVAHINALANLNQLSLNGTSITERGVSELVNLDQLQTLILPCALSDTGVGTMADNHPQLTYLVFYGNDVSEEGLRRLASLKSLKRLQIRGATIAGGAVRHLSELKDLRVLELTSCNIPEDGFSELGRLPQLTLLDLRHSTVSDKDLLHLVTLSNLDKLQVVATSVTVSGVAALQQALPDCRIEWGDEHRRLAMWVLEHKGEVGLRRRADGVEIQATNPGDLPQDAFDTHSVIFNDKENFGDRELIEMNIQSPLYGLWLSGTAITNSGLQQLPGKQIRQLNLNYTNVDDAGMHFVKDVQGLSQLQITGTAVTDAGVAEIAAIDSLQQLVLQQTKITDHALVSLRRLPNLTILCLIGTQITDDGLADVAVHRNLKNLQIQDCKNITDAGIQNLAGLVALETLELPAGLTDASIEHLSGMSRLTKLSFHIGSSEISDASVKRIAELFPRLTSITLQHGNMTDEGLRHLISLNRLTKIALNGTKITDAGLAELKQLPNLEHLGIGGNDITDAGLEHLAALRKLRLLHVVQTKVTPRGVARLQQSLPECHIVYDDPHRRLAEWVLQRGGSVVIGGGQYIHAMSELPLAEFAVSEVHFTAQDAELKDNDFDAFADMCKGIELAKLIISNQLTTDQVVPKLRGLFIVRLNFSGVAISDANLSQLSEIEHLIHVYLAGTKVTDKGVAKLAAMPQITSLGLVSNLITDESLRHLKKLPKLEELTLNNAYITGYGLEHLTVHKTLRNLHFYGSPFGDEGLQYLGVISSLEMLSLTRTKISDSGLTHLKALSKLSALNLSSTAVTDAGLEHLKDLKQLRLLDLSHTAVTPEGVAKLQRSLPDCHIVYDDPHRRLAEWVLQRGGYLRIGGTELVYHTDELPTTAFNVGHVYFDQKESAIVDDDIDTLVELCRGIHLGGLLLNNQPITDDVLPRLQGLSCSRVNLGSGPISDTNLHHLSHIENLHSVTLHTTSVTDVGISVLADMPRIRDLYVPSNVITDDGLKHLRRLPNLQTIQLTGTPITGYGLEHLTVHKSLRQLELDNTSIGDEGVQHVAAIESLEKLMLGSTKISDAGLAQLKPLSSLSELRLHHTAVTDAGLQHLKELKSLQSLDLKATDVTFKGVAELQRALPDCKIDWDNPHRRLAEWVLLQAGTVHVQMADGLITNLEPGDALPDVAFATQFIGFRNVESMHDNQLETLSALCRRIELPQLDLSYTTITSMGIAHLAGLRIGKLSLINVDVTDAAIEHFEKMKGLGVLRLGHTNITDGGVLRISYLSNLVALDLGFTSVTDQSLQHVRKLSNLEQLSAMSTHVSDYGLKHLTGLQKLRELQLANNQIGDAGMKHLGNLRSLRKLELHYTQVGDTGAEELKHLTNLEILNLNNTLITDAALQHLKALKSLQSVYLKLTAVTFEGVADLQQALPDCKIEWDDPHRELAEWVIQQGGSVRIQSGETAPKVWVASLDELPADVFIAVSVDLNGRSGVNDQQLAEFAQLCPTTDLEALNLADTSITSAGLAFLKGLSIKTLFLSRTGIDSDGIQYLQQVNGLVTVHVTENELTDQAVSRLAQIASLRDLDLGGTKITDRALQYLEARPELEYLNISSTGISDYGLEQLREHKQLHALLASYNQIGDAGIQHIGELTSLSRLELHKAKLTDVGLQHLNKLHQLTILSLTGTQLTDEAMKTLANSHPGLTHLTLQNVNIGDTGIAHLALLKNLERLLINGTQVTDEGLAHLSSHSQLSELWLSQTAVTDAGLKHLSGLRNLRRLDVQQTAVTSAGAAALQKAIPDCVITFDQLGSIGAEMIVDDGDAAYSEISLQGSPGWRSGEEFVDQAYDGDYRVANAGAATARWDFKNIEHGHYDIFTTWTAAPNHADEAVYVVYDGSVAIGRTSVNQRNAPDHHHSAGHVWDKLGTYKSMYGTLRVELDSRISKGAERGGVIADAVRIVRVAASSDVN